LSAFKSGLSQPVAAVPWDPQPARFSLRSVFKTSNQVQGQGVPRIENGAYTSVREYFNSRDNAAIGPQMGF
jgi:hypothetical protein